MRIHKLVNEALKAVEAAQDAKVAGQDSQPHLECANDILKNQIGKHPHRRAFFGNKKSPFFEVYVELLRKVDEWMYPIEEGEGAQVEQIKRGGQVNQKDHSSRNGQSSQGIQLSQPAHLSTAQRTNPSPDKQNIPLAERFAQMRRVSVPNSERQRPPIPKLDPILRMPEPPQASEPLERKPISVPAPATVLATNTIAAPILHKLLLEWSNSILILDVRDRASYKAFHVDVPHSACLEFFSITRAETQTDLADSLVVAPQKEQRAFAWRDNAKMVVLVDDGDTAHPQALDRIKTILCEFKVVELQGGIQAWKSYSLPLTRSTPSPEPPTPFTDQLVIDGKVVGHEGMIQSTAPMQQRPPQLVSYPTVPVPQASPPPLANRVDHGVASEYHRPRVDPIGYAARGSLNVPEQSRPPPPVPPHDNRQSQRQRFQNHTHQQLTHSHSHHPASYMPPPQLICGLKNLGNSCYMNCVLQCLFGTNELIAPFLSGVYSRYINPRSRLGYSGRLAHEFARLVSVIAQSGQNQYVAPFDFKNLVGHLQDTFRGYDQQDCQEFLTFLLDGLHEDLNSRGDAPHEPALTEAQEKMRESYDVRVAAACEWERYMKINASLVVDEIQGQYASRLECTVCHTTSTTYTAFSTLTLPLKHRKNVDLSQCFDSFLSPAVLEGENAWFCPRCQRKQKTIQYLKISRLPRILIIHLKRFRQKRSLSGGTTADKLETTVRYPLYHLDLTKYWTPVHELSERDARVWRSLPSRSQDPPFIYDLYAVTSHHGSLKSGHYTAFVRKANGWFYFDDTNVVPLRDNNVVTRNAYVLFYRRREHVG